MGVDFHSYFTEQFPRLVAELDYIVGDRDLANDVAQDAFVRQYVSWSRLQHFDKPGAWVRKVALRIAFKLRRRLFHVVPLDQIEEPHTEDPSTGRSLDIRRAILQLTPTQRTVVVLHYYRDLPLTEIAAITDLKEGNIRLLPASGLYFYVGITTARKRSHE